MNSRSHKIKGTTLVELMVAVALLGIISLGIVGVFSSITKGIHTSRSRTLATNLAQEQMQILKQKSFNKVLVTTSTMYLTQFTPDVPYDPGYYPPETILEGGIDFRRYTYIQVAEENSGTLSYFGAIPDTGMKAITVTVVWSEGTTDKKLQIKSILANIETTVANCVLRGKVSYATNTAVGIPGALVTVAENVGWADTTDASGNYRINVNVGSYRMFTTARGFFTQYANASVTSNGTTTTDFQMVAMSSGTVRGTAWITDHLVISQVVGSTRNATTGECSEFVELYNPSTYTWTIASNASTPVIDLYYQRYGDATPTPITMNYSSFTIQPKGYYLFANTSSVTIAGVMRTADAVYAASNVGYPDLIHTSGVGPCASGTPDADSVGIMYTFGSDWIDKLGWTKDLGTHQPPMYEGTAIMQVGTMQDGQQYVRRMSTSSVQSNALGRGYDSGTNNTDFIANNPALMQPRNSASTSTLVSGTPAVGAWVTANDGFSQAVSAVSMGSPPYAQFSLTPVATGTWNVIITSDVWEMEYASVTVTNGGFTMIPSSDTSPTWNATSYHAVVMSSIVTQGFVTGWVRDVFGSAITNPITGIPVYAGGNSVNANTTNGTYFLRVAPGNYDVVANQNNTSSSYVSLTSANITVQLGVITSGVNFTLSQGGRIRGFVTRDGTNALAGVAVVATDANDVTRDQEVTGSNGQYYLVNLSTGQYVVEPVLGSGETSSPSSATVTVTAGSTVHATTFTIVGSYGTIRGNVTLAASSVPIRTGVLIVCTTSTISGAPPTLSSNTLTGIGYYMTNSYEDGTYTLDVRGSTSTNYNLYAYYTTFNGTVSSTTVRPRLNVPVVAGSTTWGISFTW